MIWVLIITISSCFQEMGCIKTAVEIQEKFNTETECKEYGKSMSAAYADTVSNSYTSDFKCFSIKKAAVSEESK